METQDTIREWRAATFGTSATTIRSAVRAQEELVEFLRALTSEQFDRARAEAADSMICLCGFADRTGERIDFRMSHAPAVNHERAISYAVRANEILARAIGLCAAGATVLEVADVARFVLAAGTWLGADMQAEIDAKMQINRGRVWKLDGSGHGYHVRTAEPVEINAPRVEAIVGSRPPVITITAVPGTLAEPIIGLGRCDSEPRDFSDDDDDERPRVTESPFANGEFDR